MAFRRLAIAKCSLHFALLAIFIMSPLIMSILLYLAGHSESIVQMLLFSFVRMSEARSKKAVGGWVSKHRLHSSFLTSCLIHAQSHLAKME